MRDLDSSAENPVSRPPTPGKVGVLVVDDDVLVRDVLKTWLQRLGFKVWLASGGLKGVVLYRQHQDAIAVALLDVNMPGLDGPDTLRALQEINPRLRACFMSGWVGKYTALDLFQRGALCILDKPLRLDEVSRLLRRMTESGAAAWSDREGLGVARHSSMQPPAAAATADPLAGS